MTETDGRRARGEARRQELVDAALRLLEERGVGALTHRAIAAEAGVPLASASYHFAGIDDLILTALLQGNQELVDTLAREGDRRDLGGLAALLSADLTERRHLYLAYYELYLHAARRPDLRAAATGWLDLLADHYASGLGETERRVFQASIDGLSLLAVVHGESPSAAEIERSLTIATAGLDLPSP